MAYTDLNLGMLASAGITAGQVVEVTGSGTVGPAGVGSLKTIGVAYGDALTGQPVSVITEGAVDLIAGAAIVAGASLEMNAAGQVITQAVFNAQKQVGIAITAAAGAAATVTVLLK